MNTDRAAGRKRRHARALTLRRSAELSLAALVAGGGLFTAFVTDAAPQNPAHAPSADPGALALSAPFVDLDAYSLPQASDGSRQAVAAALSRSGAALRLAEPYPYSLASSDETGFDLGPDVQLRARARAVDGSRWSGSALGVQLTASTRTLSDLPPVFLVGGAGRESYVIAPSGMLDYTFAPAGAFASVGDAHFGVGLEVNDDLFVTAGYVREQRHYRMGARDWSEEDHYAGLALRARW
ncbi:hypothetical protein F1654_03440 [Alkalicaulis satelles]|uniref:Uncharacterized protein n=1 Tax=Alkalicaulis satelles TaxID=2609175 RepID=A0A5M6ZJT2_9PROT|nr:hypothetical protein [Alkalicaulis satelles]KAA5805059.1 hypothetical protein F1654_03440 [Alkalicaulis satelles]